MNSYEVIAQTATLRVQTYGAPFVEFQYNNITYKVNDIPVGMKELIITVPDTAL